MAKDPIIFKECLLHLQELFESLKVTMVSYIETKGHGRVDLCVMDFLSITFMESGMIFLNGIEIVID